MNTGLKTIIVTGSNKGIGYGIIKGLLQKQNEYNLILTSRNKQLGIKSLEDLKIEYPEKSHRLYYHELDITNEESISSCISWIKNEFGKIDILVNNAAVATKGPDFNIDVFNYTFPTNVYGTISLTEQFINTDIIKNNGKIVTVGSSAGKIKYLSESLQKEFLDEEITLNKLLDLSERFKNAIINNSVKEEGWIESAYATSKMIINTYSKVLARRKEIQERQISVYSCCPGWVRTDMAGPKALLSIEEGVITPIFLIELPDGINSEYQGRFIYECKVTALN